MKVTHYRQEHIIEAAIKRFVHFGIQKTTLTEIADDLALSRQALFYYFPDKPSLIAAVEDKIIAEYIATLEKEFLSKNSIEAALLKLAEVRMAFFEKYYMLASRLEAGGTSLSGKTLAQVKQSLHEREVVLLAQLFKRGIAVGELQPLDPLKTADLLLHTVSALAHCVRDKAFPPECSAVEDVFQKQKEVLQLFYNGLKNQGYGRTDH